MKMRGEETRRKNNSYVAASSSDDGDARDDDSEERGNGDAEQRRKTVLVGMKLDPASHELLTWALVKVASPCDRVLALHVVSAAAAAADGLDDSDGRSADALLSILSVYEGFCNLKQIDLKLKICRGSSIRKALVREANSCSAEKLILGVAKNCHAFRSSSTSIAKHCSKKLQPYCSVLAVSNGKIIYQSGSVQIPQSKAAYGPKRSYSKLNASARDDSSVCSASSNPNKESRINESSALVVFEGTRPSNSSAPTSIRDFANITSGWPFLRRKFLPNRNTTAALERSKISVVQWAMQLPSRYTAVQTASPDRKAATPCSNGNANKEEKEIPEELVALKEKYSSIYTQFSYEELAHITSNFSPEKIIGKGGNSHVYKGHLPNGKELAVKALKSSDEMSKEFIPEIEIISAVHHKNIISLLGFCIDNDNLVLVYDYLPRGSVEEVLHGERESKMSFSWNERYKVAVGVARALNYLHGDGNNQPVIHRDVKSSNILLSDDFEPKLSDFGLALWASAPTSHIECNDVAGTFGYLAPEYFMYGKVNEKIDVYAFGVVLLELVSGRKPVSSESPKGQGSLVMWATSILRGGKLGQLVDTSLPADHNPDLIERMTLAASLCIRRAPQSRPQISTVLNLLLGDDDTLQWARSQRSEESDRVEDGAELHVNNNKIQSFINLALLDVDDDSASVSSAEQPDFVTAHNSLEDYLRGRWSRSSSAIY